MFAIYLVGWVPHSSSSEQWVQCPHECKGWIRIAMISYLKIRPLCAWIMINTTLAEIKKIDENRNGPSDYVMSLGPNNPTQ